MSGKKNGNASEKPSAEMVALPEEPRDVKPSPIALAADVLALIPDVQAMAPLQRELFTSPYVQFMDSRAGNYSDVIQKIGNVPAGTPVLIFPDGRVYRLDNMQYWLTPFRFQHWSVLDQKNTPLQSAVDVDKIPNDGKRWAEFVETVALVMTPDGIFPARIGFKTTKTPAAHEVYNSLNECINNPDKWAAQSVDHATAMAIIPQAWLRMHGIVQLKTGKGDYDYIQANATVKPTSAGQFATIVAALNHPDCKKLLQSCIEGHNERIEEIKKKCI